MRVKEKTEKADLKLSIQKTKTMASDHITLWQIEGPSLLCLPQDRPMNPRHKVSRQGRNFNRGASRPKRWQASASK